jgi:hypothetical protein
MNQSRTVSIGTTTGSIIRDVIPARSHLKNRAMIRISVVVVIDEEEVGRGVPFACSIGVSQSLNEWQEFSKKMLMNVLPEQLAAMAPS